MSEISSMINAHDVKLTENKLIGLSKNNAWKSEWEKAQMDLANNNSQNNDKNVVDRKYSPIQIDENVKLVEQKSEKLVNTETDINKSAADLSQSGQMQAGSAVSSKISNINVTNELQQIQGVNMVPSHNVSSSKYSSQSKLSNAALFFELEAKYSSKYKLQNLSIVMTESGAKIMMRDYRINKADLTKVVEEIKTHLATFGVDVKQAIVNGIVSK